MDPNEVVVSAHNLADIQNYLVTFNKEIEGSDPSSMPVITDADGSDVNDILASVSVSHSGGDSSNGGHFSTAFYADASLLDSGLGEDSAHNMHSLTMTEVDVGDSDLVTQIKQEASGLELDDASMAAVHAQLASLTGNFSDMTSQELIMTAVNDGLDASEGKVIRIVSLSQDGSILSLGDGSHMQILGEDSSSHIGEIKDLGSSLDGLGQPLVMSSTSDHLLESPTSSNNANSSADLMTTDMGEEVCDGGDDGGGHQLVAIQPGLEGLSPETLQALAMSSDGSSGGTPLVLSTAGSSLQTVALVPSEGQNGEVQYVLLFTQPPDTGNKEMSAINIGGVNIGGVLGLKDDVGQLTEEDYIQEDGTVKRILKITPKKLFPTSLSSNSQLTCTYCNYTSPKRYLLTRHMKTHSEDRPHKCNVCQRGFKTVASLTNHVNTHTGTRPHKCKECEAAFTTSGELVRHIRYRHTFEKPHKCPECDYASVELSKLKRHLRSHTGERPYQCPTCSYASPDTYKLKRHMRIHTGEKPYVCDVCNARFTQSNSLKAHKLIHSGNKPVFQCQYCPTTCGRKTDLKIHMQKLHYSDEPVTCRKCGESFPDRYNFKLHWKTHEGEKCYKCNVCDYSACSQRHLESHILTHSGQKPFECDECDHTFRQKQLLKRHKNHHHTADYQPPTPKDKSHDCKACDKTYAHKGNLVRHMIKHTCGEGGGDISEDDTASAGSADGESSLRSITADHVLHGNLMQEWREGKLGNAPQVVIVHPDGRIEEVTPKLQLPPDRTLDSQPGVEEEGEEQEEGEEKGDDKSPDGVGTTTHKRSAGSSKVNVDEDDGNQREAGTQVELASDSCDDDDDEGDDSMDQGLQHFLTTSRAVSSNLNSVLGAGGVTLLPAGSAADLENMIANLPLVQTPVTSAQQTATSQEQPMPTIDAPEFLSHLDFSNTVIKQERLDPSDPSDNQHITVTLMPASSSPSSTTSSPTKVVMATSTKSWTPGQTVVVTAGKRGVTAASTSASETVVSSPKVVTVMIGGAAEAGDRRTRSMKRKDVEEQASPAKRTRKAVADQRYTYI